MKKILLAILILGGGSAGAQDNFFYVALDAGATFSNTSWVKDFSARGLHGGYRAFITDRISAGLEVGWNVYSEYHPTRTIEDGNGALTSDYFHYVYQYSLVASGQYNFPVGDGDRFFPYAGIGVGANTNEYVSYYNIYTDQERGWGFVARPEAGIVVKFGQRRSMGIIAAVHYDYSTNRSELFGYDNFNTAGFKIGLVMGN